MTESKEYLRSLIESSSFQNDVLGSVIEALDLPVGSRGLDVGCGFGAQVMQLAEAVGLDGHVTGLDISSEFLKYGTRIARERGMGNRTSLVEGDMNHLPFNDDSFDWAWSASCVGYFPGDPMPALREMARVVRSGGTIAIIVWSSETLLPGYPLLEARLRETTAGLAPFKKGMDPEHHHMRLMGKLRKAGMEDVSGRSFVRDVQHPMTDKLRKAITGLIEMRWPGAESELSKEDRGKYLRLCDPESPDFILDLPDYYGLFTYTLFHGKSP